MKKLINLANKDISYTLKISSRARRMRLAIYSDGDFIVTVPRSMNLKTAERFLFKKSAWIIKKLTYLKDNPSLETKFLSASDSKKNYQKYKELARILVQERLAYFNKIYKFSFERVSIRNQKTRWGSCSRKGNLNFNYKIYLLPAKLADYIIVHELCHLKELNHSSRFWVLVARTIPNYLALRKELLRGGDSLLLK